jgi:pilus assembly protein CpaE
MAVRHRPGRAVDIDRAFEEESGEVYDPPTNEVDQPGGGQSEQWHEPPRRAPFGADLHLPTVAQASPPAKFIQQVQTRMLSAVGTLPAERARRPVPQVPSPRDPTAQNVAPVAPAAAPHLGELVVFFSCHGGTGSTMLATNAGVTLARNMRPTCAVDLDLQLGDVLTLLGLTAGYPMSKIAGQMESFDWEMLAPQVVRHPSGLCVLSQVGHIEELSELDAGRVPSFLRYLQQHFRYVIVDGLRDFNDHSLAALDVADKIVLVVTQDISGIRGAAARFRILEQLGYPRERFYLVLNRYDRRRPITAAHVRDALECPPCCLVANDFITVDRAITEGRTLAEVRPEAQVTRDVDHLTREIFGLPALPAKRGFLDRLLGRRG